MLLTDLVTLLLAEDKNILIPDTCVLLDVIRAPFRDNWPVIETAIRMEREIQGGQLPFSLVLPSLFEKEWNDNVQTVQEELTKHFRFHQTLSRNADRLHREYTGQPLNIPNLPAYAFEQQLIQTCQHLIQAARTIEAKTFHDRAMQRVIDCKAPASRGKREPKDCLIFEEVLGIGESLRQQSFQRKIVFSSSNAEDYGKPGQLKPDIQSDSAKFGIDFADFLNYAYHRASK